MANFKLMPDVVDLREVTFTNLLLLGFDVEVNETQYRVPFTRDMFSVPNRKGMEAIMYFLFVKLNADSAKETFKSCWPIFDRKQEQEFRKICTEWLTKINKEDTDARLPTIAPSLLITPGGERFYQFLFYFSVYVLKQKLSRLPAKYGVSPSWPTLSSANKKYLPQLIRSLQVSTINKKSRLLEALCSTYAPNLYQILHSRLILFLESLKPTKSEWTKFAREQSKEHRKLSKLRRECEKEIKELRSVQEQIFGKGTVSSKEALKRTQNLQKVNYLWKTISKLFEAEKVLQEKLDEVLNKNIDKTSLDGEKINFKIPDILLRECERQLHAGKRYNNLYESGNVNLLSLIQLWNLSLHLIKETLSQFPLPNVEEDECYVRAEAHNHGNNLNGFTSLRNTLSDRVLPDLKLSVEEVKDTIKEKATSSHPQINKFGLDFLPPTPPVFFKTEGAEGVASSSDTFFNSQKGQYVDTPDAVDVLLHRIRKDRVKDETPVRVPQQSKESQTTSKKSKSRKAYFKERVSGSTIKKDRGVQSKIPLHKKVNHRQPQQRNQCLLSNNPTKLTFKTPARQLTQQEQQHQQQLQQSLSLKQHKQQEKPSSQNNTKKLDQGLGKQIAPKTVQETPKPLKTKAQDLLVDQIAQSILNETHKTEQGADSDTEELLEESARMHALDDPIEAFGTKAFLSRDKVPRTPAPKQKYTAKTFNESLEQTHPTTPELTPVPKCDNKIMINKQTIPERESPVITRENGVAIHSDALSSSVSPISSDTFDLNALQESIKEIKPRGGAFVQSNLEDPQCEPEFSPVQTNGIRSYGNTTPSNGDIFSGTKDNDKYISPLHDIDTPVCTSKTSTFKTPLIDFDFSDGGMTPKNIIDVEFTSSKTNTNPEQDLQGSVTPQFDGVGSTTDVVINRNREDVDMMQFTPLRPDGSAAEMKQLARVSPKPAIQDTENAKKEKGEWELFLENNKQLLPSIIDKKYVDSILDESPVRDTDEENTSITHTKGNKVPSFHEKSYSHVSLIDTPLDLKNMPVSITNLKNKIEYPSVNKKQPTFTSMNTPTFEARNTSFIKKTPILEAEKTVGMKTPTLDTVNLETFITPFKDPFSPLSPTSTKSPTVGIPILDLSTEDVDEFINEVISNTAAKKLTSGVSFQRIGMKTPRLFGGLDKSPNFENDYSLMTPGIEESKPFRLDFSDDDEF